MATTITQRISLEGADDIQNKLKALGAAGQAAFKQIQDAAAKPITDPAQLERTRQALQNIATAAQQAGNAMQKAGEQAQTAGEQAGSGLQSAAVKFGLAATGLAVAIGAIARSLVSGAGDAAQKLQDQADKLGFTTEQWTALTRSIAAAGNSTEEFVNSVSGLMPVLNQLTTAGKSVTSFADGAKVTILTTAKLTPQLQQLQAVLEKFGVRRDIIDQGSLAVLNELARIIDGMPEGTAKAAAGIQFFGANWRKTVEDLTVGAKAVGETADELDNMRRASRQMTPEEQAAAKAAKDNWDQVGEAITAVKNKIGALLAPGSAATAKWLSNLIDDSRMLLDTWLKIGDVDKQKLFVANLDDSPAKRLLSVLTSIGALMAGDFSGFWKQFSAAAVEAFNTIVEAAKKSAVGQQLIDIYNQVKDVLVTIGTVADQVAAKLNEMFGTKFTGAGLLALLAIGQFTGALKTLVVVLELVAVPLIALNAAIGIVAGSLGLLTGAVRLVISVFGLLVPAIRGVATAMTLLAANPWSIAVIAAIVAVGAAIYLLITYWPQIKQAAIDASDAIYAKWQALKAFFDAWIGTPVANAWQWLNTTFWDAVGVLQSYMDTVTGWIQTWVTTPVANAWQWIKDTFWQVVHDLTSGGGAGVPPDTSGGQRIASAGIIGGRGSGTSDSNLAWVSRGEHIMPAAAVSQPGVLAFLEALRQSGGNLQGVMNRLGRFAAGGLVMPSLGGAGMSHVTIAFPGLAPISGLRASSDVVAELQRAAALAQVRSGGRKPSRYT